MGNAPPKKPSNDEDSSKLYFDGRTPPSMRKQLATELTGPNSKGAFLTYEEFRLKYNNEDEIQFSRKVARMEKGDERSIHPPSWPLFFGTPSDAENYAKDTKAGNNMTLYGVQGNLMSCSKKIAENIMKPMKPLDGTPPLNVYLDLGGQKLDKHDFIRVCLAAKVARGEVVERWNALPATQKNRWKSHRKLNHRLISEIIKLMIELWDKDPTYCQSIPIESPLGPDKVSTTLGDTFFDIDEAVKYATALGTGKIELADGTTRTAINWDFGRICRNYGILGTTGKNLLRFKTDLIGDGVRVSSGFIDRVFSSLLLELGRRGSLKRIWHDYTGETPVNIRISGYAAPVVLCSHGLDNFKTTGNINSLLFHAELMTGYTSVNSKQEVAICPLTSVSAQYKPSSEDNQTRELFFSVSEGDLNTSESFDSSDYYRQLQLRLLVLDKLVSNGVSTKTVGTFDTMPAVGGGGSGGGSAATVVTGVPVDTAPAAATVPAPVTAVPAPVAAVPAPAATVSAPAATVSAPAATVSDVAALGKRKASEVGIRGDPAKRRGGRRYNVAGQRRNRRKRSTRKYNRSGKKKKTRVKRRKNRTRSKRRKNRTRTKRIRKLISKRKYNL